LVSNHVAAGLTTAAATGVGIGMIVGIIILAVVGMFVGGWIGKKMHQRSNPFPKSPESESEGPPSYSDVSDLSSNKKIDQSPEITKGAHQRFRSKLPEGSEANKGKRFSSKSITKVLSGKRKFASSDSDGPQSSSDDTPKKGK